MPDGLALTRAVIAHFDDRRHQPLLDSERALREMAQGILATTPVEPTRDQIAQDYAKALAIIDGLRQQRDELLAALSPLLDLMNDDLDPAQAAAWDAAGAAIAKAEGR